MSDIGQSAIGGPRSREPFIDWRAIVGGAVLAAGVSATLNVFGAGIGLAIMSSAPTWREASPWLWLLSGVFLIFVSLCSFGFGGYMAGRMRHETGAPAHESHIRDGLHGIIAWALAILIAGFLAVAGLALGAGAASGTNSSTASAGESLLALELDELFRSDHMAIPADRRAEAARILLKAGSRSGVPNDDRSYLTNVVANYAGADNPDVRVDRAVARSATAIRNARTAGVIQAFMIAAALFLGAAVSWFSAKQGGLDREAKIYPVWNWKWRVVRN